MIHLHLPPCTEYRLYQTSSHSCYPVQAGGKKSKMIQGVPINMIQGVPINMIQVVPINMIQGVPINMIQGVPINMGVE